MKTPDPIKQYRNKVIEVLKWALNEEYISDEQYNQLKDEIIGIELELYPKKLVEDENGNLIYASEYYYGKPFDEWE